MIHFFFYFSYQASPRLGSTPTAITSPTSGGTPVPAYGRPGTGSKPTARRPSAELGQ
jgi:hypothetical protein